MKFNDMKSNTLDLRVSPSFKLALKAAAEHDQRSMMNMLEVLVGNYCDSHHMLSRRTTSPLETCRARAVEERFHEPT